MKIIHCLNHYMPQVMAGTEVYTHTLACLQKEMGNEVAVITPHIDYHLPGKIKEHYVYDGIDVYQYLETGNPKDRQIHYGKKEPDGLLYFKQLIEMLQPDVIHFHELNRSIGFTVTHVRIAKQYGAKTILTAHLSTYTCNTNVLVKNGELCNGKIDEKICTLCSYKKLFNIPSFMVTPLASFSFFLKSSGLGSNLPDGKLATLLKAPATIERIKNDLKDLTDNLDQFVCYGKWYKNILIENGVPENKISVVPAALVTVKNSKYDSHRHAPVTLPIKMVFIGRIQPTKGIHLMIEAMRFFTRQQVQMDFYGITEETTYFKKCIEDSSGMEGIKWKGILSREDVLSCLSQYNIFCLASTFSEMSPLVIQEAFAAGIPVLASKVYGNMEQIKDGFNGLLFDFNSVDSLKEKIALLIDNPSLLNVLRGNIVAPISFKEINVAYLQLYDSL